ncbi:isochorismate synthase DhbC [Goodfellowiella coeruleoviolacea]|uniref:isochorismate synthase n=1 Tax=Goodfellowiella coeruleoviolacea TaxID=334858 RepID=A0AAE3GAF2_9PSEU|nr:isochorismate synthase DhbC [Goodfellowiella coeruleoviolacea]MCP2163845.1 isochorismate synthase [Goodfellowiella coeruleoviolacea]
MTTDHQVLPDLADQLLADYRPGVASFFATRRHTLLGQGVHTLIRPDPASGAVTDLASQVRETLERVRTRGTATPIAVGAVPFDNSAPAVGPLAKLVVPETIRFAGPLTRQVIVAGRAAPAEEPRTDWHIEQIPEPAAYRRGVAAALTRLAEGELDKVVLARSLRLTSDTDVDVPAMLRALARRDPHGYTFAVDLDDPDDQTAPPACRGTLVGASPELLLAKTGRQVVSRPLAGSAARASDPAEDRRRAEALLASAKDRHEHALVVAAVARSLGPFCRQLTVPTEPHLVRTAAMWHLATRITGELADERTSSLELAAALHPTPAVCGTPVGAARAAIAEIEPFDRGFYTGVVGWCDSAGDGEWVVTLRCGVANGGTLTLFAGAGIVPGSVPESELAETSAKFRTFLTAAGVHQPV